jgi:hypothetical protein
MASDTYERVECECGQLIARRRHNHIEPIGAPMTLDIKGRPVIVCPSCGRFTVMRRTVKEDA